MESERVTSNIELALFRVTVHPNGSLIPLPGKPDELLKAAIDEAPWKESRKKTIWKIGNITHTEDFSYFRVGRTKHPKISKLDGQGNFVDEQGSEAPYAHVFLDRKFDIFGVSKNIDLAPAYPITAGRLVELLNTSLYSNEQNFSFQLRDIYDPREFTTRLKDAYAVFKLWVRMLRKNPWDAEEDFIKPLGNVLEGLRGQSALTEWTGSALDVNQKQVDAIISTAAATGGDVGATVKDTEQSRNKRIRLKKGLVTINIERETTYYDIFIQIRSRYLEVRNG